MPVLKNLDTGLSEDLPKEVADSALASGTHEVPLINPQGEHGSAKLEDASALMQQGYRQPKTEELKEDLSTTAHTNTSNQIAASIEGLGRGVLGPASDAILQATGVDPEDIRKREEIYSGTHGIAEAAGLVSSGLAGVGLGGALNKLGSVARAGKDASFIAKVAASAGRGAIENAAFQAQDEVSKLIQNDPAQTAESAISNVGMSALLGAGIGGGLGAVPASWDALMDSKAGKFIGDFTGRVREHLDIPNPTPAVEPTSIYKSDIFGEGMPHPGASFEGTPGGKAADALIRNGLSEQIAGSIGAVGGSSIGHPILGYLFGKNTITPLIEKILPAIMRPLLNTEASGVGLKSAVGYAMQAIKGQNALNKAAASVFGESTHIEDPTDKDRRQLKEQLEKLETNQEALLDTGKHVGTYMPAHAQAMAETAVRNSQYLNGLKPIVAPTSPLDEPRTPNASEEAHYNRALDIAQSPMIVTKAIKDGSLTIADIKHIKTMYPSLYTSLSQKLVSNLIDKKTDKAAIPYKTKLGLSAFLGQPLDSSMSPLAITASQSMGMQPAQPPQPKNGSAPKNMNKLDKLPQQSNTMTGSREAYRSSRH